MFNKKISLVLITLVFMLSLSVVSAVDDNSTDDVATGDVEEEPPSGSAIELSTDNNLSSEEPDDAGLDSELTAQDDVLASDESADAVAGSQLTNQDDDLLSSKSTSKVKANYELTGNNVKMYYDGDSDYVLTLSKGEKPVKNAAIKVTINNVNYEVTTNKLGKASVPLDLDAGSYTASASYGKLTAKNTIKILPVIVAKNHVTTYGSTNYFSALFLKSDGSPLKDTDVQFIVNGKKFDTKTNSEGVATLRYKFKVGKYTVTAVHPNGYKTSKKMKIEHSVTAKNLKKYYKGSKWFTATFHGKSGKLLNKKYVEFHYNGKTYKVKTNIKGKAGFFAKSFPGTYKIVSYNPKTSERITNTIKILPTLYADNMSVFSDSTSKFKLTVYKSNGKLAKNTKVHIYIHGAKKVVKTNNNGVATVKFKLNRGTYHFKSVDLLTGYERYTKVVVKNPSIKASSMKVLQNKEHTFKATLFKQNGKPAKDRKVKITINGVSHVVKTNSKGVASVKFKLSKGTYKAICKDLVSGYKLTKKIKSCTRLEFSYNKYGVSHDGKTILAIGRPSAIHEESRYGYTFYMCEFKRVCPYCHGHNLYWSIFWAGNEYSDVGRFPATGYKEPSSAEGGIFCADCDCDFSIFGHNRADVGDGGFVGGHLTKVMKPVKSTKEAAYKLKSGHYVKT